MGIFGCFLGFLSVFWGSLEVFVVFLRLMVKHFKNIGFPKFFFYKNLGFQRFFDQNLIFFCIFSAVFFYVIWPYIFRYNFQMSMEMRRT